MSGSGPNEHDPGPAHDSGRFRRVLTDPAPAEVEARIVEGALERMRAPAPAAGSGRLVWGLALAGAAAAVVLLGLWLGGLVGGLEVDRGGGTLAGVKLDTGPAPAIVVGTEWVTEVEERTLRIGPHEARLAPRARLRLAAGTSRAPALELHRGSARFSVEPLGGGETFSVQTPQARVTVLGTRFSVELSAGCTSVEVFSGRVRFAPEEGGEPRVLGAGERASHCEPPAPAPALDEAGRRVRRAITLARKGSEKLAQAERLLAGYLEQQPRGTYAEEALYFLVRIKQRMGKQAEAARLARTFVERFPSTARAGELRSWLAGQPRP